MATNSNSGTLSIVPDREIGMGYSDDTQMGTSTFCVDSKNISLHGKPVSVVDFGSSMDFSKTQSDLGVDVSASVSVDKFSGSLAAQYAKSIQDVGYSISYSFVYKINLPTQILHINKFGPDALNDFGRGALKEGLTRFKEVCGNKFVAQESTGAKLYATLNVEFNSRNDKEKFAANFKGSISDLGSAALDIKGAAQTQKVSGSVKLSAIQEGGNVMRLTGIFGKTEVNNVLNCRLESKESDPDSNIQKCIAAITDIINYAKQDFSNQISYDSTGKGAIVGVPTSLGYAYLEYDKIGIDELQTGVTDEVLGIRKFLGQTDDEMLRLNAYLKKLIYSSGVNGIIEQKAKPDLHPTVEGKWYWVPELINIEAKAQLKASYSNVNKIINALESPYNGAIQCYKDPKNCNEVNSTIANIKNSNPIATNTIDFFKKAYQIYCDGTDYGLRYLLPLGANNENKPTYLEKSDFYKIINATSNFLSKNITNFYTIVTSKEAGGERVAEINANNIGCGRYPEKSISDMVPIYEGIISDDRCVKALCLNDSPLSNLRITFYEVDSPI